MANPDFSAIASMTFADAKKPPVLPEDIYPAVIVSTPKIGQNRMDPPRPIATIAVKLAGWPEGSEPMDGVDLSQRPALYRDFMLSPEAAFRFAEFARSCGIDLGGKDGQPARQFQEFAPEFLGQSVSVSLTIYTNPRTGESTNQIAKIWGPEQTD